MKSKQNFLKLKLMREKIKLSIYIQWLINTNKIDSSFKNLQQEFAIKLMALEKKQKRERESKQKAQEEVKILKRELLEKESQWKRQASMMKNQELKALTEWDLNKIAQKLE